MPLVQGQAYSIINTATSTYLDLSSADNQTVQGWQNNGGYSNQKWVALTAGDGWIFKNGRTGDYLSLTNYCGGSMSRVVVSNFPVVWKVSPSANSSGAYVLTLPLSTDGLALDLAGAYIKDGTNIIVHTPHGNANQVWKFVTS